MGSEAIYETEQAGPLVIRLTPVATSEIINRNGIISGFGRYNC
jgi:hypothetical protein